MVAFCYNVSEASKITNRDGHYCYATVNSHNNVICKPYQGISDNCLCSTANGSGTCYFESRKRTSRKLRVKVHHWLIKNINKSLFYIIFYFFNNLSTLTKIIIDGWHLPSKLKSINANYLNKVDNVSATILEILIFRKKSKSDAEIRSPLIYKVLNNWR